MKKDVCYFELRRTRQENKEYWQAQRLHNKSEAKKDEATRKFALQNACRKCHAIRSSYEIQNGTCDNCD